MLRVGTGIQTTWPLVIQIVQIPIWTDIYYNILILLHKYVNIGRCYVFGQVFKQLDPYLFRLFKYLSEQISTTIFLSYCISMWYREMLRVQTGIQTTWLLVIQIVQIPIWTDIYYNILILLHKYVNIGRCYVLGQVFKQLDPYLFRLFKYLSEQISPCTHMPLFIAILYRKNCKNITPGLNPCNTYPSHGDIYLACYSWQQIGVFFFFFHKALRILTFSSTNSLR